MHGTMLKISHAYTMTHGTVAIVQISGHFDLGLESYLSFGVWLMVSMLFVIALLQDYGLPDAGCMPYAATDHHAFMKKGMKSCPAEHHW